jgi:ribosomal protein L25 (general stress protein Ctc)
MSVKTINITLDEKEFQNAMKKKGNRTWKEVLMDGLEKEVKQV